MYMRGGKVGPQSDAIRNAGTLAMLFFNLTKDSIKDFQRRIDISFITFCIFYTVHNVANIIFFSLEVRGNFKRYFQ